MSNVTRKTMHDFTKFFGPVYDVLSKKTEQVMPG